MMKYTNLRKMVVLLLLGAFPMLPGLVSAQEHPEHPTTEKPKAALSMEQLAQAIQDYVAADAQAKGGYFLVYDPVAKKPLVLNLDRVHQDRLSGLGGGVYFACADFKSLDGTTYDVDVFMKESETGLETTEVHIHKVGGKPRYTWKEQGGVWVRDKVK